MTEDTLKCPSCGLNQFVNAAETCKRCKRPLILPVAACAEPTPLPEPTKWRHYSSDQGDALMAQISVCVKRFRLQKGLSQRQLAFRAECPRTYISKVENCGAQPTVVSLMRIALAMGVTVSQIISNAEEAMHKEAR